MKVTIVCKCNATFSLFSWSRVRDVFTCPNCKSSLPDNASADLIEAFKAYELFDAKLSNNGPYEITISDR